MTSSWHLTTLWSAAVTLSICISSSQGEAPHDIYRFFPDHSFWSSKVACTERERECFKDQKLLFEEDGKCYAVREQGPCAAGEVFYVDKAEAKRRGGHLRGTCKQQCSGVDYAPLAATGECMSRRDVHEKICRSEWYLQPVRDVFGQWVCKWTVLVCNPSKPFAYEGFNSPVFDGLCSPPNIEYTSSYEKVPVNRPYDHPLLRYTANHTALNREFPCTKQEEDCLRYGRLLASDGNCYGIFDRPPECGGFVTFNLDWDEATKENGKLKGTCDRPCLLFEESLTRTDRCIDYSQIAPQVCRNEWGMNAMTDVFGQIICGCSRPFGQSAPSTVSPPASTPGYCRVPDFSNPVQSPQYDQTLRLGFEVPCSEEEFACLRRGEVLWDGKCFALRSRGPCAENEQLVLDKEALAHAQIKLSCQGPCAAGSVLMPVDDGCFTFAKVKSLICPTQEIALDEFGGWQCSFEAVSPANLTTITRDPSKGTCLLPDNINVPGGGGGGAIGGGGFSVGGNTGGR